MDDTNPKDDNPNVDFYSPEGGPGPDANWRAPVHQEPAPLGGSSEIVASQPKESEWPMGVRKSVEVNGKKWEYLEYGNPDGQPILNVHGWLGSSAEGQDHLSRAFAGESQNSQGLQNLEQYKDPENPEKDYKQTADSIRDGIKALKGKYHIIAPDLPGFGRTEALDNPSLDAMSDELAEFMKTVGLEKPVVFGASMGGILATKLAARHPEEIKALVLQGTMTEPKDMLQWLVYRPSQVLTLKPISAFLRMIHASRFLVKNTITLGKDYRMADQETKQRIKRDIDRAELSTAYTTLREVGRNIGNDINKVKARVVVIDGVNGELVEILNSARVATRFHPEVPNAEKVSEKKVIFLPVGGRAGEQGHNIINTFPEGTAALIDDVLDNITK